MNKLFLASNDHRILQPNGIIISDVVKFVYLSKTDKMIPLLKSDMNKKAGDFLYLINTSEIIEPKK